MESVSSKTSPKFKRSSADRINESKGENESTSFAEHITYDVLRMIFEYCSAKDLAKASMVCRVLYSTCLFLTDFTRDSIYSRSWREAAGKEMKTRMKPETFHCELSSQDEYHLPKGIVDNLFIKPAIGLAFYNKLSRNECLMHNMCARQDHPCYKFNCDEDFLTILNSGLIYNDNEIECESNTISGLFLPDIPDVKIKCFRISENHMKVFKTSSRESNKIARKLCKILPDEENIKCIMMFCNEYMPLLDNYYKYGKKLLKNLILYRSKKSKDAIAVIGGMTKHVFMCNQYTKICPVSIPLAGISVCGTGVSSWSLILGKDVKSRAQVEKKLTAFRETVKLQRYTVGFMFACCGRGSQWYSEQNVESGIFRKLFPNVPLVGSFGDGEYGQTTIHCNPEDVDNSPRNSLTHQYSTVFLIITYGSTRESR